MLCFRKLSQKSLERIVGDPAEIWSGWPRNTSQKNYRLNQYARPETVLNVWMSLRRQRKFFLSYSSQWQHRYVFKTWYYI
jgi:hypothetical protein